MSDILNDITTPNDAPLKRCTGCGETKSHSEFSKDKAQRDGLQLHCKQCNAKYRSENSDKISERRARWYRENAAKIREYQARYSRENAAKERERHARYYRENADEVRESQARYQRENPAKVRECQARWHQANPAKTRAENHRRRATKRALPSQWSDVDVQRMLAYWGNRCAICEQRVEPNNAFYYLAQDHWIPITSPECPGTVPCNMLPLCHSKIGNALGCNSAKHDADPIAWLHRLYPDDPKLVAKILARIAKYFKYAKT